MAKERLSEKALYVERGYGQVEPNHLSAQRTGQIYAQLPTAASVKLLENGQFVKYNYKEGQVDFTGAGEWMLVYNEVKVYGDFEQDSDFALKAADYNARIYNAAGDTINGEKHTSMVPRVFKTNVGDIFTTNTIAAASVNVGDVLAPGEDGYLAVNGAAEGMKWQVVKLYTMPDGQKGVKIMRIA